MIHRMEVWFSVSIATIVVALTLIGVIRPLWGIDFVGGTLLELKSKQMGVVASDVSQLLQQKLGLAAIVQTTQDHSILIRTTSMTEGQHADILKTLQAASIADEELRFESIGPTIGAQLRQKSWLAISLAIIGMIGYLAYSFRHTVGTIAPWKFGVAATYALIHDLAFVTAIFVLLGKWKGVAIDSLFVTAILSVMGYSVNDTIVIFDRLREEWLRSRGTPLREIMDKAAVLSVIRSINTSITILLVLLAMVVLGGSTIRWFIVALIAGTIVGTYSSIFVATPCLYFLATRSRRRG